MNEQPETPEAPGAAMSPPAQGEVAMEEYRESRWPKVIGGISLAYAIGGLLCQVTAGAMTFVGEWLARLGGIEMEIPMTLKLTQFFVVMLTSCVGIVMLVGAAKLLRRRRGGVGLLRTWAVLRAVLVLVGLVVVVLTAPAQVQMQRSALEMQNERLREAGREDLIRDVTDEQLWQRQLRNSLIFSGVLLVYPVFLGVYLSRGRIQDEIASWD